jgi:hypothetical protein
VPTGHETWLTGTHVHFVIKLVRDKNFTCKFTVLFIRALEMWSNGGGQLLEKTDWITATMNPLAGTKFVSTAFGYPIR